MIQTPFDSSAVSYDSDFTHSFIGKAQREIVHNYLENFLSGRENLRVLELACGTGEDAAFLAGNGCNVLATDNSGIMLNTAKAKIEAAGLLDKVCLRNIDIHNLSSEIFEDKFDLIFSNFGGINCITIKKLKELSFTFKEILNPSGRIILVIMSSFTLWEFIYFSYKGKLKEAVRRLNKAGINVPLKGSSIMTYYYSPAQIRKIFSDFFIPVSVKPIGFFIPPSYLENYFIKKPGLFGKLGKMEKLTKNFSLLSSFSDHFLIDMRKKR